MKYLLIVIICCFSFSTTNAQRQIDIEAHRGGRALMPENTIPAMINAVNIGARTLELDCYITADGQVVVSHDAYMTSILARKPDGSELTKADEKKYVLFKMPYDSIRLFQLGVKPIAEFPELKLVKTYKPLLGELIDSVEHYVRKHHLKPVNYNIETKSKPGADGVLQPVPEEFVKRLMKVLNSKSILNRVIIQSFDPRTLRLVHQQYPQIRISLLSGKNNYDNDIKNLGFKPTIYSPYFKVVDEEMIKKAHADHVKIITWTPDDEADILRLANMGVDGIISDYPDRLVRLFGSYQTSE